MDAQLKIRRPFQHPENYGPFNAILTNGTMTLYTNDINRVTYVYYLDCIMNFMVDGVEDSIWHGAGKVRVIFSDKEECILTLNDLLFNMILWYVAIKVDEPISSRFLFYDENITQKSITTYINNNFLNKNRKTYTNRFLNNVIADCTATLERIDMVAKYLADTVNLYDDVALMAACPDYWQALHTDLSGQALDKVRLTIDKSAETAINIIKDSKKYLGYKHSLASNFISGEGLNKKQFGEVYIGIGTKPDANGDVIHHIINSSFLNGGVEDDRARYIESYAGKKATIMSHINVSDAGAFARKLILLNQTSMLHRKRGYVCNTRNYETVYVDCKETLERLDMRYYKDNSNGIVKYLSKHDTFLIGQTIYLYSPMTCASYARGQGVCYRCYGDLAYVNCDVNIGILAAEILSNTFTQRMLSSKHLLETVITYIEWVKEFDEYFSVDIDQISFDPEKNPKGYRIIFKVDDVQEDDDSDDEDYDDEDEMFDTHQNYETKYYTTEFTLECPDGTKIPIYSKNLDRMYMSKDLYSKFENKKNKDPDATMVTIPMDSIESPLFTVSVENTELTKALVVISQILDKVSVTSSMNKDQILQAFLEALNNANIKFNAVHAEILLSNQIKSKDNIFKAPAWEYDNEEYTILSLRQALLKHPSFSVSMAFQDINKQLNSPSTYDKTTPSQLDLNMVTKPQPYLQSIPIVRKAHDITETLTASHIDKNVNNGGPINPFVIRDNNNN